MTVAATVDLPPNKTYTARVAAFVRVLGRVPLTGVVVVTERADAEAEKFRVRRYAAVEVPADGGRAFRLTKPGGTETYHVALTGRAADDRCTCVGFLQAGNCCHLQALSALRRAGHLNT